MEPNIVNSAYTAARRAPTKRKPSYPTMKRWLCDGVAHATDGCRVEPDGICQHGHVSWLIYLGYV